MTVLLDAAGRRRSPVTMPGYHGARPTSSWGSTRSMCVTPSQQVPAMPCCRGRYLGDEGRRLRGPYFALSAEAGDSSEAQPHRSGASGN
jgi:hypothetical protein